MNDATIATHEVPKSEIPCDSVAGRIGEPLLKRSAGRVRQLFGTADYAIFEPPAVWQVREDQDVYIPDFLSDERYDYKQESFSAATDHAKHLTKAQALVGDAMHLVRMMAEAGCDEGDRRAMQIEAACNVIEKKLRKAYNGIDKHDRRHTNLFLAYADLKEKADK